jgi:hypothetical protein
MATTQITLGYPAGTNIFRETAIGSTALAIKATSTTLYYLDIDNTANAAISYLKLYNLASGSVTVGTTAPDWIIMIAASTRLTIPIPAGTAFGTALAAACLTAGGTAGTTAPTSAVILQAVYA